MWEETLSMPQIILIVVVGFALVLLLGKLFAPSLEKQIAAAIAGGDLQPLLDAIGKRREGSQPDAYNRAIRRIWDEYQRERAVPLIRALAEAHGESLIAQYWLDQLQSVEPELARESLGEAFLKQHFKPKVAAACGPVG
jgi:hypothetical protein